MRARRGILENERDVLATRVGEVADTRVNLDVSIDYRIRLSRVGKPQCTSNKNVIYPVYIYIFHPSKP